jgi:hypothetical protein
LKAGREQSIYCLHFAWAGPLLEQPLSEVTEGVYTYAIAHYVFAKAVLPLLKDSPDSAYIIITGAGGKSACSHRSFVLAS